MRTPLGETEWSKVTQADIRTKMETTIALPQYRDLDRPYCMLPDDMGLGKTLTMISLIMKQKQLKENGTEEDKQTWLSRDKQLEKLSKKLVKSRATLVICPASLIHQWKTEIERRVKGSRLKVMLYHGPDRESDILRLADNDVVLTTYNLVAKEVGAADINAEDPAKDEDPDEEDKKDELSAVKHKSDSKMLRIAWDRIVLDEAHNIKNHKSLTAVAVCRLRAGFRWALTGTPIQNKLLDIFSLLRFLRCSPFDEYKLWKKQVERDNSGHSRLNVLVKCLLLRRTKNQVDKAGKPLVALPTKTVKEYEIKLSDNERKVYEKIFAQSKDVMRDYLKRHGEKDIDTSSQSSTSNVNPFQDKSPSKIVGQGSQATGGGLALNTQQRPGGQMILVMLLRLRQCCCHLSLMKDALEDEIAEDEGLELDIVEQMRGMGLEEEGTKEPSLTKSNACFEKDSLSTKVEAVIKKLREIRDSSEKSRRQKSVIVSQWTKMLDIIAVHLDRMGVKYSVIQGNIPPKKRNEFVEDFNTNPKGSEVMLVSLRAGGVGLNLIGGNHLFLLDQHWNPALEDQACDRIYRVGQTRDVMIHRFLCKDTVEEKIVQLQDSKKKLADNVLTGSKATSSKLTLQDLRMIFGV
ncbi:transcription termination factor 2 [Mytilus galloprovincialis]|uniref:Transcription termination factor 2 n=3 Tax=Mytilus galloprovincialis TaxID=29158 RepID=A0A8B6F6E5_MYTGA|nr:transcription termination factor 2 [Mytilus galloprovincialis]